MPGSRHVSQLATFGWTRVYILGLVPVCSKRVVARQRQHRMIMDGGSLFPSHYHILIQHPPPSTWSTPKQLRQTRSLSARTLPLPSSLFLVKVIDAVRGASPAPAL
jgi:hypothetical protein